MLKLKLTIFSYNFNTNSRCTTFSVGEFKEMLLKELKRCVDNRLN